MHMTMHAALLTCPHGDGAGSQVDLLRAQSQCAWAGHAYLVHDDPEMGDFCCKRCRWKQLKPSRASSGMRRRE